MIVIHTFNVARIILCHDFRAPELFSIPDTARAAMPVPTPVPESSQLLTQLGDLVRQAASDTPGSARSVTGQLNNGFVIDSNELENM